MRTILNYIGHIVKVEWHDWVFSNLFHCFFLFLPNSSFVKKSKVKIKKLNESNRNAMLCEALTIPSPNPIWLHKFSPLFYIMPSRDVISWNVMILVDNGNNDKALETFKEMWFAAYNQVLFHDILIDAKMEALGPRMLTFHSSYLWLSMVHQLDLH